MEIEIKEASLTDLNELMNWRMQVLKAVFELKNKKEYQILFNENKRYYQRAIPSGEHIAVFAESNGVKVGCGGMCLYREMPSPDNLTGTCAYLMNIYTPKEYREHGIAKQVVKWLTNRAVNLGIEKIFLETTDKARNLYKSLDFTDLNNYMILEETHERDH